MNYSSSFNLSNCKVVNYLWPQFVERIGIDKAKRAVEQAFDLQRMNGNCETFPVLLFETCGLALVSNELVSLQTGLPCNRNGIVLILSIRDNLIQLLCEV